MDEHHPSILKTFMYSIFIHGIDIAHRFTQNAPWGYSTVDVQTFNELWTIVEETRIRRTAEL